MENQEKNDNIGKKLKSTENLNTQHKCLWWRKVPSDFTALSPSRKYLYPGD